MQRKKTVYKGLQFIDVWYTDTSLTSPDYFRISEFPTRLTAGKNLFKLLGNTTTLKVGGYLNLEILDYNGDPIYYEIVDYIDEDTSRVIAIYIYEDTSPGDCTITLIAESVNAPTEWQDRPNIKWTRTVQVNPTVANDSEIIFETLPEITLSEQIGAHLDRTYTTSQFPTYTTGKIKYFLLNNQPAIEIDGGSFINDMKGGTITVAAPQNATPLPTYTPSTTAYTSSIKKILSPTTALLDTAYTARSSKNIFPHIYTNFANSSFSLKYESTPTYTTTQNSESYALIQIAGLQPATGDVSRIKTYMNNNGTVGTWELINDIELAETEIFVSNTASLYPDQSIGVFVTQSTIDTYWTSSTYNGNAITTAPVLTWTTASISNAMRISSSVDISAKNAVTVAQIKNNYQGVFNQGSSYKITIDALGTKTNTQNPKISFYLSGSSFDYNTTDFLNQVLPVKLGKRIGEIEVTTTNQRFDDYVINFEADNTGTAVLLVVVEAGIWQVADIRTTSDNDPGYTPDYIRIKSLVPTAHKSNNQLSFKIEYYNVAGVKSKQINYSLNNDWQGGNRYIDGDFSMITGSVWVGDSLSKGIGITGGQNAGHVMSAGYQGFNIGKPGFLMWSGSVLPGKTSFGNIPYSGVGLELYQNANNYFRYSTSDNLLDINTQTFILGTYPGTYIYGDSALGLAISSSNFALDFAGNVTMSGTITATAGNIGGFTINTNALSNANNFYISGAATGNGFFISSSKFNVKANGDITGSNVLFTGGKIGGFTISNNTLSNANNFYISGAASGNDFFISSSKFNVKANGDVTGSNVLFTGGKIAGFTISDNTLSNSSNFFISGAASGNDFFISSSKFNVKANGDVTASSALFSGSVSITGNINATTGNIGGFAITQDAITGSGFYLSGSAENNEFFISASKFNIKASGDITGSNVLFTGGKIGSFTLTNNALSAGTTFLISSSVDLSNLSTAFFISSSKFNVRQDGTVSGSQVLFDGGKVGGFTIDSSKITGTNIVIDSAGSIQTSDYASDLKGWKISAAGNGSAEFENAKIRGTLATTVFEKTSVNAVGGQLYVANSTTLTGSSFAGASTNGNYTPTQTTMSVENVTGFETGEILTAKKFSGTGFATEYLYVNSASRDGVGDTDLTGRLYVTRAYGNGLTGNSASLGESPSAAQSYSGSQVIVSTGKLGTGFIRINANPNDTATPYIDIVERTGSGIYDVALKARLGDLSGLANNSYVFGKSNPGFGLATDNVFLQGGIIANTGSIGGIKMESSKLFTGTSGTYNDPNTGFYLDSSGYFSLKDKLSWNGTTLIVSGTINATTGNIGGFAITRDAITGSGFYLSGSATGNGFFISSSKFNVKANGDVTASSALFSGSVSVTGNINATTGNIGGFAITRDAITGSSVLISGSATTGTQFFISSSKFNVKGNGDVTGSNVLFTGGKIAGFTISDNTLSNSSNFFISGSATGNDFFISSSNFNVKANGDVTASNANIGGRIEALSFVQSHIKLLDSNSGSYQTAGSTVASKNLVFDGSVGGLPIGAMTIATTTGFQISGITTAGGSNQLTDVTLFISTAGVTLIAAIADAPIAEGSKN